MDSARDYWSLTLRTTVLIFCVGFITRDQGVYDKFISDPDHLFFKVSTEPYHEPMTGIEPSATSGTTCYKDESIGDRDGNLYYCEDGTNTECCTEDGSFACCEPTSKKTLREQLILWGCVIGVGLLIALCCCYFWRESLCCKDDTPLSQRCCCCCRNKNKEDKASLTSDPGPMSSHQRKTFTTSPWAPSGRLSPDIGHDSPPPPFHYKKPTVTKY